MKIVVAGGGLQGTEASYLAGKAGWETTVIDKKEFAPASGLCDHYLKLDLLAGGKTLERLLDQADLVVPALEDLPALERLQQVAERVGVPLAYDAANYKLTASKILSDALFTEQGIPAPRPWPGCHLPVIAKPSESSGSKGVTMINRPEGIERLLAAKDSEGEQWVIQEFLPGDSYSIEVFGCNGNYLPLQVTDLGMDVHFDCRCVTAPTKLPSNKVTEFQDLAVRIAGLINLQGIMDVEVIDHQGVLKVLEIDARLPSQTPTVVYHSTGVNMLRVLDDVFVRHNLPSVSWPASPEAVIYEHILVEKGRLETLGEHIISSAGPLALMPGFFGADEVLTDYHPGKKRWVATLIFTGNKFDEVSARRCDTITAICRHFQLQLPDINKLPPMEAGIRDE